MIIKMLKNKWVKLILIINVLILIIIAVIAIDNAQKTATISIDVAPIDAEILIGGQKYENGAHQIKPGTYDVKIAREGLSTKEFTINVSGDSVTNLVIFLSNSGNFDFYTLNGNYASFYALSQIASGANNVTTDQDKSAEDFIASYQKAFDLYRTALPINYSEYETFDYGRSLTTDITIKRKEDDCVKALCMEALILTTGDRDGKKIANDLLIDKGFRLEDYEIEYKIY